jgi:hypothetical protein
VALVRVYCGVAAAEMAPWLTVAVVDDSGRLLDMRHISDDPAGYAYLGALLADRSGGGAPVAMDRHEHLVAQLLAAANRPLAIADEASLADFAERFSDDTSYEEMQAPISQRNAVWLARALQAGALYATAQSPSWNLDEFKPVLAAHAAVTAGRQAAAAALREVLRELYPAALRAYPDPAEYVPLKILEALPEPGLLTASPSSRSRESALVAELSSTGVADTATAVSAITALRVAVEESPRWNTNRALAPVVSETVKQSVAAVRACDSASAALIATLVERLGAMTGGNAPTRPFLVHSSSTTAPVSPAVPRRAFGPAAEVPPGRLSPRASAASAAAAGLPAAVTVPAQRSGSDYAAPAAFGQSAPSSYQEPAYQQPAYQQPAYREPSYQEPAYQEPAYQEPAYQEPSYREPYQAPSYREPAYQEPAYQEPAYEAAKGYRDPGYQDPGYQAASYLSPAASYAQNGYQPSGYQQSEYRQNGYQENEYQEPAAYAEQRYDPPGHAEAGYPAPGVRPQGSRNSWPLVPSQEDEFAAVYAALPAPTPLVAEAAIATTLAFSLDPLNGPLGVAAAAMSPAWNGSTRQVSETASLRLVEGARPANGSSPPNLRLIDGGRQDEPPRPSAEDTDLLIFSQTQSNSAWFVLADENAPAEETPTWGRLADEGWRAAEQLAQPSVGADTTAGLPRRVPKANLVPGSAEEPPRQLRIVRDPQSIAAHTSGYFRGWQRGQEIGGYAVGQRDRAAWEFNREQRARETEDHRARLS